MKKEIKRQGLILGLLVVSLLFFSEISQAANFEVRIISEKANVRLKPTIDSNIIATLPLGAVLESEGKIDNWYYVKLPKTQEGFTIFGYVHASLVEIVREPSKIKEAKEAEEVKEVVPPKIKVEKPPNVEPSYPVKRRPAPHAFKIGGGINTPFGDWSEYYDIGFSVNGSVIYPVSPGIDLIGGAEFSRSTGKSTKYKYDDHEWGADFSFSRIIFFGDARYSFKGETKFFVEGGLGIYSDKEKIELKTESWWGETETLAISDSRTNLGIRIGAGAVFSNIEIMGLFHMVENSNMFTFVASFRF